VRRHRKHWGKDALSSERKKNNAHARNFSSNAVGGSISAASKSVAKSVSKHQRYQHRKKNGVGERKSVSEKAAAKRWHRAALARASKQRCFRLIS